MFEVIDMTGWVMSEHGVPDSKITVLYRAPDYVKPSGSKLARWWCMCDCGNPNLFIVNGTFLRSGNTKSCGCIRKTLVTLRNKQDNRKICEYSQLLSDEHGNYYIGRTTNTNKEFYIDGKK